jgi:hypothetical protein
MFACRCALASSSNIARARLGAAKGAKTLIRAVAYQCLETEPNCVRVRPGPANRLGFPKERLVNVEGLLHTYDYAI